MKGCLILSGASPRNSPRPPARKCVSFCGSGSSSASSSDDEQEIVEVHVADDWDRTPCEVTPKLTYQDLLELHELKSSAAYPQDKSGHRRTQLLNRVPVGLLPLLSEPSAAPAKPPPPSNVGSKNTSSGNDTSLPRQPQFPRKSHSPAPPKPATGLAAKFSFLPLMPVDDHSTSCQQTAQSLINPQSPATVPNRFQKKFQFLPLLADESTSSCSSPDAPSDDDHASPISTPSLTASSSLPSPPGTPSATSSPSLTPSSIHNVSAPDVDYFNFHRPPAGTNQNADQSHSTGVDSSLSKLTLQALPNPGLIPPSPLNIHGTSSQPEKKTSEKLDNSSRLCRKGGKRCVVEYININGVDEPFYTYVDDDEPPSPAEKSNSAS